MAIQEEKAYYYRDVELSRPLHPEQIKEMLGRTAATFGTADYLRAPSAVGASGIKTYAPELSLPDGRGFRVMERDTPGGKTGLLKEYADYGRLVMVGTTADSITLTNEFAAEIETQDALPASTELFPSPLPAPDSLL